jgi:hypothetical protein
MFDVDPLQRTLLKVQFIQKALAELENAQLHWES